MSPLANIIMIEVETYLTEHAKMQLQTDPFFVSEWRGPLRRKTACAMIRHYGTLARLPIEAHPYMLRQRTASP